MDTCIPTEIAREFVPVVFLVAPTNEWTLGFHFIRYARLTELALFKPARGSPLDSVQMSAVGNEISNGATNWLWENA